MREDKRKESIRLLISEYGQGIIERIIKDSNKSVYAIWPMVFTYSDDHLRDLRCLIEHDITPGLKYYLKRLDIADIKMILNETVNRERIIANLPYRKDIFELIKGDNEEKLYWESQNGPTRLEELSDYVFEKFIVFAPYKLLESMAYFCPVNYEQGVRLLQAIGEMINDESKRDLLQEEVYALQEFVKKMDEKYYTEELSKCEFGVLSLLLCTYPSDYPLGVKRYFWDHPEFLGQLLLQLDSSKETLAKNSLGQKMLFEAYCAFGSGCYISAEYLIQRKDELKEWVNRVVIQGQFAGDREKRLIKSAIINILACCPRSIGTEVWPTVEIADILESLSKTNYDDPYMVSINFCAAYINRRGVRTVQDGSAEFALSAEFSRYKEKYIYSHPVTSRALEYIANGYQAEGEEDKFRAALGTL